MIIPESLQIIKHNYEPLQKRPTVFKSFYF